MQDTAQLHPIAIIAGTDLTAVGRTFLGNQTPFPLPVATSVDLCPNPLCVPQSKGWAGGGPGCPQHCRLPRPFPFSPPPRDLCAERGLLHSPIAPHRPPHPPSPQVFILYFKPSTFRCIALRWVRVLGFAIVYGTITLKLYRYWGGWGGPAGMLDGVRPHAHPRCPTGFSGPSWPVQHSVCPTRPADAC